MVRKTDLDRSLEFEENRLGDEDLTSLGTEVPDLGFQELDLFSRTAASHLQQPVDDGVQVDIVLISHGVLLLNNLNRKYGETRKKNERTI